MLAVPPAANCCSEVTVIDFSSCRDFSAALRSSVFFLFDSDIRLLSSLASIEEVIVPNRPRRFEDALGPISPFRAEDVVDRRHLGQKPGLAI